jgi:hypothetical protein
MKTFEVVMVVEVEASSHEAAVRRARLAASLANEYLKGEWAWEPVMLEVRQVSAKDESQQELPL